MKADCLMLSILSVLSRLATSTKNESFEVQSDDNSTACHWFHNRTCPDSEIRFYLYTRLNFDDRQLIDTWGPSNLSSSFFNPKNPSKIIIHGFRADMFLTPLFKMKTEYLNRGKYNIFYVDWYNLSSSFCYPAVVHNIKHVGECTAQLVNHIRHAGSANIHVIGFSLGAQVANYVANSLKPDYVLPRITGLDPALPLFITSDKKDKLDASDAKFVDVFHCNGLMQGQIFKCGHVDFYMNGGIYQPGCGSDIFSCSHHRCPNYFMESIRSTVGFYGWKCQSFLHYILGLCPFTTVNMLLAGEDCDINARGMYLVKTNSEFPYAMGRPDDEARTARDNDDELKIQLEALKFIREKIEHEKFMASLDAAEKDGYEMLLAKFSALNHRNPKVLSINEG